jgi:hypothetical protein
MTERDVEQVVDQVVKQVMKQVMKQELQRVENQGANWGAWRPVRGSKSSDDRSVTHKARLGRSGECAKHAVPDDAAPQHMSGRGTMQTSRNGDGGWIRAS